MYFDSKNQNNFSLIDDDYKFKMSPENIVLLDNPTLGEKGYVNFYDFKILNTGSGANFEN